MTRRHPLRLYGHRGDPSRYPECTMLGFRGALDAGANALELDVHVTAEDRPVVCHDADTGRTCGTSRRIATSTLEEIRALDAGWAHVDAHGRRPFAGRGVRVPTLDEVIEGLPEVVLNVDVKARHPDAARAVVDTVHRHEAEGRVILTSFHGSVLRAIRAHGYRGGTGLSRREVALLLLAPPALRGAPPGAVAAQVPLSAGPFRFDTEAFVGRCHDLGLRVDFFTVDDVETARRLLALGADGLMSDDPGALAPLLASSAPG